MSDTSNIRELLINVVTFNKPNVLTGLNQKVCGEEWPLATGRSWTATAGEEEGSAPLGDSCEAG
jgi:hypothetical protein